MADWMPPGYTRVAGAARPVDDDVSMAMIRLWCEVLEDANPAYYDDDAAVSHGLKGVIAPPPMIMTWAGRAEWSPVGPALSLAEAFQRESPEFPHSVGLTSIQRHVRPLYVGERLTVHEFVSDLSEPHQTARGFGCVQRRYTGLRDQSGEELASIEFEALRMRLPGERGVSEPDLPPIRTLDGPPADPSDPVPGQVLPSLSMELSLKRCVKWVAATRDYNDVHHNREYARRTGAQDLYIGVHFGHGLVCRSITDWSGPIGRVRRMAFTHWGRCFLGETVAVSGRVMSVGRGSGGEREATIELTVGCERGLVYDVEADVALGPDESLR
jgi:acyl dehydratase